MLVLIAMVIAAGAIPSLSGCSRDNTTLGRLIDAFGGDAYQLPEEGAREVG